MAIKINSNATEEAQPPTYAASAMNTGSELPLPLATNAPSSPNWLWDALEIDGGTSHIDAHMPAIDILGDNYPDMGAFALEWPGLWAIDEDSAFQSQNALG
jgi:hypothetical protein